jgi:hypothetical protein
MKATPALMLPRSIAIVLGVLFATAMIASLNGCQRGAAQAPRAPARSPASSARDFGPHISPTTCALCAETNPLFVVDKDGNASGAVRLRNRGKEAVTLQLTLSDFSALADDGRTDLLNAVSTLSAVDTAAKPILEGTAQLQPDRWIEVKISAANLWQAGLSTAALMNGTEKLIDLRALRYNVPFNIKVQGATPERADVSFSKSQEGAVTLRNDDPMTYRFRWKVEIDGRAIENVDVVRPYKSIRLPITLPPESFPWLATGTLRPDVREGLLTLEYEPDTGLRNYPLPVKRYPITARLSYWGETAQTIWNSAWILTLLLLGIGASLLVNFALPLQKQRVLIKKRLADLEGRLAGLDEVIDPIDGRLLNQMRVEKKRLREELSILQPIFPQSADDLPRLDERITALGRRIDLVSKVGELLLRLERQAGDFSMAEGQQVRMRCREILETAAKMSPSQDELQEADRQLTSTTDAVNKPNAPLAPTLIKELQTRAKTLIVDARSVMALPQSMSFAELLRTLENQFPPQPQEGAPDHQPTRRDFIRQEEAVRKTALVVDFVRLVDQFDNAGIRDRRLAQQERLLRALDPGPDASLQKACEIVEQTRENVYVEDVVGEIENAAISIEVDPPRPLPYQLTDFSLRFARAGVDRAVARKEIVYEWSVNGEKLPAEDWSVTWFFQDKWRWLKTIQRTLTFWNRTTQAHYQVRVNLKKPGMESSLRQLEQDVTLERTRSSVEAQTWLSLGTLGVTILAVVLGLASGAEEKLRSVELLPGAIAVFLLGFGADTLKTLITRISR